MHDKIKTNIAIALALTVTGGLLFKIFVGEARKKKYAEFYKTYDAENEFQEMKERGVFQSTR